MRPGGHFSALAGAVFVRAALFALIVIALPAGAWAASPASDPGTTVVPAIKYAAPDPVPTPQPAPAPVSVRVPVPSPVPVPVAVLGSPDGFGSAEGHFHGGRSAVAYFLRPHRSRPAWSEPGSLAGRGHVAGRWHRLPAVGFHAQRGR